MKKLILAFAFCGSFALSAHALSITDPLFMPQQGAVTAETAAGFTHHSFGLNQNITVGVTDKLSFGADIGWAKIEHGHSGLQDPSVSARYRFLDGTAEGLFLDLQGYISPEVFDSPFNGDGGSAKGTTSFGLHSIVGSTEAASNLTLAASAGFDYYGDTEYIDSGSIWSLTCAAKYYINDVHSIQAALALRGYAGFEEGHGGYGAGLDYAWEVKPETLALIPFYYVESYDNGYASTVNWGLKVKYLF